MVGYGKVAAGGILLIIGIILLIGGAIAANTYSENSKTVEDEKELRDALKKLGGDTSEYDKEIEEHEEIVSRNLAMMSGCTTIGIILLIIGIILIIKWKKDKSKMEQQPPQQPMSPGTQPYPTQQPLQQPPPSQYQQEQYPQQPPQQPQQPQQPPGY